MRDLKKFIATTIREYLNESVNILPDYINIDGENYSTKNSNDEYISKNMESIINFYKWFGNSKTIDSQKRPILYYHVSNSKFNEFIPSRFGKMGSGIYFTSIYNDIKIHNKTGGSVIYECYLKIENPMEIENPFSKRNDNNDAIFAFKDKSGEEIKVYDSNQIKSVENDGSFDINDSNIYS